MIVVEFTGISVIDPVVAVLIAAVVLWSAATLFRGSGTIFLHEAPVTRADVEERLRTVDGVTGLRDGYTWQICSEIAVATVQVDVAVGDLEEAAALTERLHRELADLGVDHATVELCHDGYDRGVQLNAHVHGG